LFHLGDDPGETKNLFFSQANKRKELRALLTELTKRKNGRTAPTDRTPIGIENIPRLDQR
jgi:hypothetical protein